MTNLASNPCIRCGRERIDGETREKKVDTLFGTTTVTITETVCPDPACQVIVAEELEVKRLKKEALDQERLDRITKMRAKRVQSKTA